MEKKGGTGAVTLVHLLEAKFGEHFQKWSLWKGLVLEAQEKESFGDSKHENDSVNNLLGFPRREMCWRKMHVFNVRRKKRRSSNSKSKQLNL